jgi:hypothetical protein
MRKIDLIISISFFLTVACTVTEEQPPEQKIVAKTSVVSSFFSPKRYIAGQHFAWLPGAERYFEDPRITDRDLKPMLVNAVQETLSNSGYQYTQNVQHADFLVGYLVALESELDDQAIAKIYGSAPGLIVQRTDDYEKGTLIIDIVDGVTKQPVWRGALQAAVTFDVDPTSRQQRVTSAVENLLNNFLQLQ